MANRMAVAVAIMRPLGVVTPSPVQTVAPVAAATSAPTAANVAADPEQWNEEDEKAERQRYARMSPLEVVEAYMRREKACKLFVEDIGEQDGVPYFDIRNTRAGRVKTAKSARKVPICAELRRLGLMDYVAAMRAAGEEYIFWKSCPARADDRWAMCSSTPSG
ncbi:MULTISPECIES: hypothetical protein [unclassified Sphingomonas]|jgi:hypothetical protein|uniref:hypothetical protein n=1 Tax=unclassified Sphingomonas TaxID=196159 RepID=UPI0025ED18A9|nr:MULTISPECIES: hypothetical protein [unclassified Sphingomonas]